MIHGDIIALTHAPETRYMVRYPYRYSEGWAGEMIRVEEPHLQFCFFSLQDHAFMVKVEDKLDKKDVAELEYICIQHESYNMFTTDEQRDAYNEMRGRRFSDERIING